MTWWNISVLLSPGHSNTTRSRLVEKLPILEDQRKEEKPPRVVKLQFTWPTITVYKFLWVLFGMLGWWISIPIFGIHTLYTLTYDVQVVFCWGQTYKCFFLRSWFFFLSPILPLYPRIFPPNKQQGINLHLLLHNYLYLILFNSSGVVFCWGQTYKCVFFFEILIFFSKSHFTPLPKDISPPIKGRAFGKEGNYGVKTKMEPPPRS